MARRLTRRRRKQADSQLALFDVAAAPAKAPAPRDREGKRPERDTRPAAKWQVDGLVHAGQGWTVSVRDHKSATATATHKDLASAVVFAAARLDLRASVTASSALEAVRLFLENETAIVAKLEAELKRGRGLRERLAGVVR